MTAIPNTPVTRLSSRLRAPGARIASSALRHERLLFGAMIVVMLVPIWAFTYLPTTDGAAHVASANVMRKIGDPALSAFKQYYYVSGRPIPNLIGHLLLAAFLYVLPPTGAEKALVSLYVVLFPLGVRYAIRAIRPRASGLAFLAFPLVYSYVFAQGFYNFCLSMGVFLFVVGYWTRHRARLNSGRVVVLGLLALVLYTCHLFSLSMACLVIGAIAVSEARRDAIERTVKQLAVTIAAFLPALIMAVIFRPSTAGHFTGDAWSFKEKLVDLLQLKSLTSYRPAETWLGGAVVCVFAALVGSVLARKLGRRAWTFSDLLLFVPAFMRGSLFRGAVVAHGLGGRARSRWDLMLLVPVLLAGAFFKAHDPTSIHFYIPHRLMLFVFLTLLLWLAGQPMPRRVRGLVPIMAGGLALGFVASHALKYREFAPQLKEFVSAGDHIKPNSTFLPLIFAPQGRNVVGQPTSIDVAPFYMAAGYIAAQRDAVDLRNYEANTDHFPVRFVAERNPYKVLAVGEGFDSIPPVVNFDRFRHAGGEVDYVLIWGATDAQRADATDLYAQLTKDYERVELTGARWTELWKRK